MSHPQEQRRGKLGIAQMLTPPPRSTSYNLWTGVVGRPKVPSCVSVSPMDKNTRSAIWGRAVQACCPTGRVLSPLSVSVLMSHWDRKKRGT